MSDFFNQMCNYVEYREDEGFITYKCNFNLSFKSSELDLILKE